MEIGQKSYLYVTDGSFDLRYEPPDTTIEHLHWPGVGVSGTFIVHNEGNTPARLRSFKRRYTKVKEWSKDKYNTETISGTVLAPKSQQHYEFEDLFQLSTKGWQDSVFDFETSADDLPATDYLLPVGPLALWARIEFENVFGSKDQVTWCWQSKLIVRKSRTLDEDTGLHGIIIKSLAPAPFGCPPD